MAILPTTPSGSTATNCTTCEQYRNVTVSFAAANPAPANGYVVKWKLASQPSSSYVQIPGPNPTSSPVTISNVPACENINVLVQSQCGASFFSSEATATATGLGNCLKCSCGMQGTSENLTYYQYPSVPICFGSTSNGATITVSYDAITRANRFTIYNDTDVTTAGNSGWVGDGGYSGPWDPGTPGNATGSFTFTYNSAKTYSLLVEAAAANPNNQTNDSWTVNLGCGSVTTYYYYSLNEYACSNCTLGGATKVGRSSTQLSATSGTHYKVGSNSYVVNTQITPAPASFDINLDNATATGSTCYIACGTTPPSNGTISIINNGGIGASLDSFDPTWFIIDTGSVPLYNSETATGTHSGYVGNFGVTVGGAMGGCLTLTVNGNMVQNLGISSAGNYTFLNVNIPSNATVVITLDYGACQ